MEEKNYTAIGEKILLNCRKQLYMTMPYLYEALCGLNISPGDDVTVSAATDGRDLYYNGVFTANIFIRGNNAAERMYLHMILHCMLRHILHKKGRQSELWDLACDTAVESILDSLPYECLKSPVSPARNKFYGECRSEMRVITAEAVYHMLLRQRRSAFEIAQLQRIFLADDHGLWDMEEKEDQKEQQDRQWQQISSRTQTGMETVLAGKAEGGEAVLEQIRVAARNDVDYRAFLRRFATPREIIKSDDDAFDYIYYTFGLQHYGNMPLIEPPETKEEHRIEDFVIAIDTSMSTSGDLVREFLSSTYSILRSTDTFTRKLNIHIIQCDDRVRSDRKIRNLDEMREYMENFSLNGGSATDFRPVFEHVEELLAAGEFSHLRGLIYFTDGMGRYPVKRPNYDVAFILLEEPPMSIQMPPWCIRILLSRDSLEKVQADEDNWAEERLEELREM